MRIVSVALLVLGVMFGLTAFAGLRHRSTTVTQAQCSPPLSTFCKNLRPMEGLSRMMESPLNRWEN